MIFVVCGSCNATTGNKTLRTARLFAYVANQGSDNISAFKISDSGFLREVGGSPFPTGMQPGEPVLDPSGNRLYVANERSNTISGFDIDADTGALTEVPGSPFPTGISPKGIVIDPFCKFLYVVNQDSNNISAYKINPDNGTLNPIFGSPYSTCTMYPSGSDPYKATMDPSGAFIYLTNGGRDTIFAYRVNPDNGGLTPVFGLPFYVGKTPGSITIARIVK